MFDMRGSGDEVRNLLTRVCRLRVHFLVSYTIDQFIYLLLVFLRYCEGPHRVADEEKSPGARWLLHVLRALGEALL